MITSSPVPASGETVAVDANFLIDSESRLKAAVSKMGGAPNVTRPSTGVGWVYQYALVDTTGQRHEEPPGLTRSDLSRAVKRVRQPHDSR